MANTQILYLEAQKREFVDKFLNEHSNYFYRMEDGKIDCIKRMSPDPPWAYIKPGYNQNCHFWHQVLFNFVFNKRKVPIHCQNCWKVVLFPRDIEELMASYILIHELGRPGKCGIEGDRANTDRFYGTYFYNNSLEDGLSCYHMVRGAVDRDKVYEAVILGAPIKVRFNNGYNEPVKVILKRACTEFEQNCGPSTEWTWDDEQIETERLAANSFAQDVVTAHISEPQIARLMYLWIHKAFQWGDKKYTMFTNGNRLFKPPVTYHDMEESKLKEFIENGKKCPR